MSSTKLKHFHHWWYTRHDSTLQIVHHDSYKSHAIVKCLHRYLLPSWLEKLDVYVSYAMPWCMFTFNKVSTEILKIIFIKGDWQKGKRLYQIILLTFVNYDLVDLINNTNKQVTKLCYQHVGEGQTDGKMLVWLVWKRCSYWASTILLYSSIFWCNDLFRRNTQHIIFRWWILALICTN